MDLFLTPGGDPTTRPTTLAELAAQVASWPGLADGQRRDLLSALQTAGRIIGKPLAAIRADDLPGLSVALYARHPSAHGMGKRRFGNVITGLRAALRLVGLHAPLANQPREKLPAAWQALVAAVSDHGQRSCLGGFARWSASKGLRPQDACDAILASYTSEMAASKISVAGGSLAGTVARAWNDAVRVVPYPAEGPLQRLTAPARRQAYAARLEDLPQSFREDLNNFTAELRGDAGNVFRRIREGNAPRLGTRPRRESTINARVFAIRQAAGLLADKGIDLASLRSLRDLVQPLERVEIVLEALAQRRKLSDDAEKKLRGAQIAQVAGTLLQAGKFVTLKESQLSTLREFVSLVTNRDRGMSQKNFERMQELSQPHARALLLHLPQQLMHRAKLEGAPTKDAARLALLAAAIEMLLLVPIRRRTLLSLELGTTIIRSGTRRAPVIELRIPGANTKNGERIPRRLPETSAKLLCEYLDIYRPLIAHADNRALFPGQDGHGARSENGLTYAIGQQVEAATGVKCTPHLFRHVAAERYLRKRPGAYEEFRHVVSNRSAEGTHEHYAVLEAQAASERFDNMILEERRKARLTALAGRKLTIRKKAVAMNKLSPAATRCLKLERWPLIDQERWTAALAQRSSPRLLRRGPFDEMRPASIAKAQDGYGRWLGFLIYTAQLDPTTEPGDRITLARFLDYIELLHSNGNRGHTIYGRVSELKSAMRCLAPNADFSWLTAPGGIPLHSVLDMQSQEVETHDPAELYRWGLELMEKAITLNGSARRRVMLRDGLLIAILASRGIRRRTLTELKLKQNIFRRNDGWFCYAEPGITKNKKPLAFCLCDSLTPWLDRYVAQERQELLSGKHHDSFWVNWNGDPLASDGLTKRLYWLSEKRFGRAHWFGPHRARHSVITRAAEISPELYSAVPAMLGHTRRTAANHYNHAGGNAAFVRFQQVLLDERARTEPLARNIFESRDPGRIGQATEEEDGF